MTFERRVLTLLLIAVICLATAGIRNSQEWYLDVFYAITISLAVSAATGNISPKERNHFEELISNRDKDAKENDRRNRQ